MLVYLQFFWDGSYHVWAQQLIDPVFQTRLEKTQRKHQKIVLKNGRNFESSPQFFLLQKARGRCQA